jgi:hypothetical protein
MVVYVAPTKLPGTVWIISKLQNMRRYIKPVNILYTSSEILEFEMKKYR